MTLLHLNASFMMTPRASSRSCRNSNQDFGPKPKNCLAGGFEAQTTNLEKCICYASSTISTHVTVVPGRSITKSSSAYAWLGQPPSWLRQHGSYSCALACWCPQVSATTINLSAILVTRSKAHVRSSLLLVHWLNPSLLDLHHAYTTKRHVAHTYSHHS